MPEAQRVLKVLKVPKKSSGTLAWAIAGILGSPVAAVEFTYYSETVTGADVVLDMVPITGGRFRMGSRPGEEGRRDDEGPVRELELAPFWMSRVEVSWDWFHLYMYSENASARGELVGAVEQSVVHGADAVSRPTPPYVPMDFGMGVDGFPAVGMTQLAARQFTKWLSLLTGRFYRLPSEAEWEYACRAGSSGAYSYGDGDKGLGEHAWFAGNAEDGYQKVGTRRANRWGLFDMHGNVAEWVLDQHKERYPESTGTVWPESLYPRVVRGGSWRDDAAELRCAARRKSRAGWQRRDPQLPRSIWYLTDAPFVGFRVVRPVQEPSEQEKMLSWEPDIEDIREILEQQRVERGLD